MDKLKSGFNHECKDNSWKQEHRFRSIAVCMLRAHCSRKKEYLKWSKFIFRRLKKRRNLENLNERPIKHFCLSRRYINCVSILSVSMKRQIEYYHSKWIYRCRRSDISERNIFRTFILITFKRCMKLRKMKKLFFQRLYSLDFRLTWWKSILWNIKSKNYFVYLVKF